MKHKDIAIKWLNGKPVQFKNTLGEWQDLGSPDTYQACHCFGDSRQYRIKPRVVRMVYYFNDITGPKHLSAVEEERYNSWLPEIQARYPAILRQEVEIPE